MTTKINLYVGPAAGFDQPFEMLLACHERVERMLSLLEKLAVRLTDSGLDQDCREAAADVIRYFDFAGPAHHQDEEIHVLPLLKAGSADGQRLASQIEKEHLLMAEQWHVLREDLKVMCAAENNAEDCSLLARDWQKRVAAFAALHRAHMVIEESMVFDPVSEQLNQTSIERMGQEMAKRRKSAST